MLSLHLVSISLEKIANTYDVKAGNSSIESLVEHLLTEPKCPRICVIMNSYKYRIPDLWIRLTYLSYEASV